MTHTVVPNTFQHPNIFVDQIMRLLSPTTNMVLSAAVRRIMGWDQHRATRRDRISLTQFREMTGLNIGSIRRAVDHLGRANILTRVGTAGDGGTQAQEYELNLGQRGDYNWDFLRGHAPYPYDPDAARSARRNPPVAVLSVLSDRTLAEVERVMDGGLSVLSDNTPACYPITPQNKETKKEDLLSLLWSQQALPLLRNRLPPITFQTWLADAQLVEDDPGFYTIVLPAYLGRAPNVGEWVKTHLGVACLQSLSQFTSPVHGVTFTFQESNHEQ